MKVKICGQTSPSDCRMSLRHGADYLGAVVEVDWSPRSLTVEEAAPIFSEFGGACFLLTWNMALERLTRTAMELRPRALQLTGRETPENVAEIKRELDIPVFKSVHLAAEGEENESEESILARMEEYAAAGADGFVLDTAAKGMYGGTGVKSDWEAAARIVKAAALPALLAGGINPSNAARAAAVPGVWGIDLASGVEHEKGKKSEEKIKELFEALRASTAKP